MIGKFFSLSFKILFVSFVLSIVLICGKNLYLTYQYQSLKIPISTEHAKQKMGEPDAIDEHPTAQEQFWVYNKTFLPAYYILVVKNNMVVEKNETISP